MESSDLLAPLVWDTAFCRTAHEATPPISEKVLTEHLWQLERDGVIHREVIQSGAPAVSYSLNVDGEKLVPIMEELCDWGSVHSEIKLGLERPSVNA